MAPDGAQRQAIFFNYFANLTAMTALAQDLVLYRGAAAVVHYPCGLCLAVHPVLAATAPSVQAHAIGSIAATYTSANEK